MSLTPYSCPERSATIVVSVRSITWLFGSCLSPDFFPWPNLLNHLGRHKPLLARSQKALQMTHTKRLGERCCGHSRQPTGNSSLHLSTRLTYKMESTFSWICPLQILVNSFFILGPGDRHDAIVLVHFTVHWFLEEKFSNILPHKKINIIRGKRQTIPLPMPDDIKRFQDVE